MDAARLATLSRFIRNQANLTDAHPHTLGPGTVKLNHAEALEVADAIDELIAPNTGSSLADVERVHILATMRAHAGDKKHVAVVLGISLKTLYNKLHEYEAMA
jgi:DNA-binding NtrC family response regulator